MTGSPEISLGIIVLNYRTADLTVNCLRSLASEVGGVPGTRVVVVDNASGDGSAEKIGAAIAREGWSAWAELSEQQRNGGFAWGNNRGWERLKSARYILLLNSDTVVHPGCLKHCWDRMEGDASIGVMSCLVLNADGSVQNVTRKFPGPANQLLAATGLPWKLPRLFGWADVEDRGWDRRTVRRDVGWLGGAFMFIRGDMIRLIGLLDEGFFFYGEDIEFCHRVWKSGWRCHYDPAVSITHYGGSSSDPTRLPEGKRSRHRWAARYLVQRKCHGRLAEAIVRGVDIASYGLRLVLMKCFGRGTEARYREMSDSFALLRQELRSCFSGEFQG